MSTAKGFARRPLNKTSCRCVQHAYAVNYRPNKQLQLLERLLQQANDNFIQLQQERTRADMQKFATFGLVVLEIR